MSDKNYPCTRILLIDDDVEACELLRDYVEPHNFTVDFAHTGREGLEHLNDGTHDLVLLDIFLPDISGIDVLRKIRETSAIPVVMLSAHNEETDHVVALELGADDYIPKTFSSRKLLAHIRAVERRFQDASMPSAESESGTVRQLRGLKLDMASMRATLDGNVLDLTTSEFRILYAMLCDPGRIFSREDLLEIVTERSYTVYDRSVDVFISSLRQKLGDDPKHPQWIRTMRGAGYMIIAG